MSQVHNAPAYKDAISHRLSAAAKMEKVRLALIEIVKLKTASGDSGRDETAPVRMMKDYYSWRKTFEDPRLIESIYNTGYLPDNMKAADDASPRETEGLKWKNDSGIVSEVNKFILSSYPNGKGAAADDYMTYAEDLAPMIPQLTDKLGFIGVKKIDANAKKKIEEVFDISSSFWRGLGEVTNSGYKLNKSYEQYDALKKFKVKFNSIEISSNCICGSIIKGMKTPKECACFGEICTPSNPLGPCMVSNEGTCSNYYKYRRDEQ